MSAIAPIDEDEDAPARDHRRSIGLKMTVLARQLRQRFDERVEQMGVTRAKFVLIATVSGNPGTTQREIATRLEVSDVTAGRMIDRLCAEGLLERRENPQDRRAYRIFLTPAAQPVLAKLAEASKAYEAEVFGKMSEVDLRALDGLLDTLADHLGHSRRDGMLRKLASMGPALKRDRDEITATAPAGDA